MLAVVGWSQLLARVLGVLLLCSSSSTAKEGWEWDRDILLDFRAGITKTGGSRLPSWNQTTGGYTDNPCAPVWRHLKCEAGRVTEIVIKDEVMQGSLSLGLRNMTELLLLDLSGNKFKGALPEEWAGPGYFPKLEVLRLEDNEFNARLPSWNVEGAWASLKEIHLGSNDFYGGLPSVWLNKKRVFKNLEELHLQNNWLGYKEYAVQQGTGNRIRYSRTSGWCPRRSFDEGSWCPPRGRKSEVGTHMPNLRVLRLSDNFFTGAIPNRWPRIFPNLQELWIDRNNLFVSSRLEPATLPASWTRTPPAFPSLRKLIMYPGNDFICYLKGESVNRDGPYEVFLAGGVTDTTQRVDAGNPWPCPNSGK